MPLFCRALFWCQFRFCFRMVIPRPLLNEQFVNKVRVHPIGLIRCPVVLFGQRHMHIEATAGTI